MSDLRSSLGEERGLVSRTAAGNRAYAGSFFDFFPFNLMVNLNPIYGNLRELSLFVLYVNDHDFDFDFALALEIAIF